jgi:outer membrane autotransporter protein
MGFDARMGEHSCVGFGFGYTHTHLNWRQRRGKANLQTGYGALYGQWRAPSGFIQSSITGGYNVYSIRRHIAFGDTAPVRATAKSSHTGGEGSFHLKSGLDLKVRRTSFLPFLGLDYIFIHENSFRERGAQSLNLKIKDKNSDLLSTEVGIDITQCFRDNNHSYTPFVRLSAIEEMRFRGKREKAVFECGGSTMLVKGLNPYRTLGAAAIGFSALLFKDNDLSAFYQGKWGRKYSDSSFYLQYLRRF